MFHALFLILNILKFAAAAEGFNAQAVYEKASPAVVAIVAASEDGAGELGSGSIVDDQGTILTNAHVIIDKSTHKPCSVLRVYFKPLKMTGDPEVDMRNPSNADVLSYDSRLDLALIRPNSLPGPIRALRLASSADVIIGERVAAIGHPEQGGLWTLTTGVISSLMADLGKVKGKTAFQTDASINRGNSGGPLLNAAGDIIGVNTSMSRKAPDGLAITSVNFALTSDVVKAWVKKNKNVAIAEAPMAPKPQPEVAAANEKAAEQAPTASQPSAAAAKASPPPAAPPSETPAPLSAKTDKPKLHETITESQPYNREQLIQAQIKEMENLEEEMHQETLKRGQDER